MFRNKSTDFFLGAVFALTFLLALLFASTASLAVPAEAGVGAQEVAECSLEVTTPECPACPECNAEQWKKLYEEKLEDWQEMVKLSREDSKKYEKEIGGLNAQVEAYEEFISYKTQTPQIDIPIQFLIGAHGDGRSITINFDRNVWALNHPSSNYWIGCTGSMKGLFDCKSVLVSYMPSSPEEVNVGDIIWFKTEYKRKYGTIHQVVEKGEDKEGVWYTTMGMANDDFLDYEQRIRFHHIKFKTLFIIPSIGVGRDANLLEPEEMQ